MKNNFEERKQNRIDHAKAQADKNEKKAETLYNTAREMGSHIPLGQPILVGHHSERADRNYRQKISNTFEKSFEASSKVEYYEEKAKAIENNKSIFSDDPNAVEKLQTKIEKLEKLQTFMKEANKYIRKKDKDSFLKLEGTTEKVWIHLNTPDCFGGLGFASYELTNNNANIKRLKVRLSQLLKVQDVPTKSEMIKGVQFIKNTEANRVQLIFKAKPSDTVRNTLSKTYNFRWCRSESAWQRHLNSAGISAATRFLENYEEE